MENCKEEELQRMKVGITTAVNQINEISVREREQGVNLEAEMNEAR